MNIIPSFNFSFHCWLIILESISWNTRVDQGSTYISLQSRCHSLLAHCPHDYGCNHPHQKTRAFYQPPKQWNLLQVFWCFHTEVSAPVNGLEWTEGHKSGAEITHQPRRNPYECLSSWGLCCSQYAIPVDLRVNTDQTQMVYQQGTQQMWNKSGAKQVSTVGQEEKWAFTLVLSISASGVVLPMQAIFMGKTLQSCLSPNAPSYAEAQKLGFCMLPLKTSTYWSTQETMRDLVNTIIAPYFKKTKVTLNLPPEQCSVWKIDCWFVHKSAEFLGWMKENHANIIVIFVPGGCTGIWQPLDVGVQRVMKLSIKRSAHCDIVDEVSAQLTSGTKDLRLNITLGTLRNWAVGWVVNTIHEISNKVLICKASWELEI